MIKKKRSLAVIPCGVALIRREREFLIAQRNADDTLGSFWEFPGGKKELQETFEACIVREAREELGVRIMVHEKLTEVRKRFKGKIVWLNFYLCSYVSGEPRPIECQRVQWADVRELGNFKFPPANDAVIEKLVKLWGQTPLAPSRKL